MIELTPEQRRALEAQNGEPLRVIDPQTQNAYVLMPADLYEQRVGPTPPPAEEPEFVVPPLVRRSQEAFWRDLPELLKSRRTRGKWVAYHGGERIGIARTDDELIRECLRRGLGKDDYWLYIIEPMPQPPWLTVEDVDYGLAEFAYEPEPPTS
jgi:hypothetical protein